MHNRERVIAIAFFSNGNGQVSNDVVGIRKALRAITEEKRGQYGGYSFLERYEASYFAEESGYWQKIQWSKGAIQ